MWTEFQHAWSRRPYLALTSGICMYWLIISRRFLFREKLSWFNASAEHFHLNIFVNVGPLLLIVFGYGIIIIYKDSWYIWDFFNKHFWAKWVMYIWHVTEAVGLYNKREASVNDNYELKLIRVQNSINTRYYLWKL